MLLSAEVLGEHADAERQHIINFERGEGRIVDWLWAGEIGWAGAEGNETMLVGESAGEMGSGYGGVNVEDVAVGVRGNWDRVVGGARDGAGS